MTRTAQQTLQTDRDAQEARWSGVQRAYSDLEHTHLEMTAAFTLVKRQLSVLEQRHAEARAEWGMLFDTLKGRVSWCLIVRWPLVVYRSLPNFVQRITVSRDKISSQ